MCKEKPIVYLVGIGMGSEKTLTEEAKQVIENCDCLIGARRILQGLTQFDKPSFCSYLPKDIHQYLKEHKEYQMPVLALSGDTGFYSGAEKAIKELREYDVRVIPGISVVSYFAAKLNTSWEDARLMSVHGREQNYIHAIMHYSKTFLLLGGRKIGEEICQKLSYYDIRDVRIVIGKNLSYDNEEIIERNGESIHPDDFEGLCAAMIENPYPNKSMRCHIRDDEFVTGEVPMTKEEVRAACIGKLALNQDAVLYDVGAGTGSIAIEAALQGADIKVYAIEKNKKAVSLIYQNIKRFCTDNVTVIEGEAPTALEALKPPTHVFIGGSTGNLPAIIRIAKQKYKDVRIVITAISLETIREIMELAAEGILEEPKITQIVVSRAKKIGEYHLMTGLNPVYIISQ